MLFAQNKKFISLPQKTRYPDKLDLNTKQKYKRNYGQIV